MVDRLKLFRMIHSLFQVLTIFLSFYIAWEIFIFIEDRTPFRFHSPIRVITMASLFLVWGAVIAIRQEHAPDLTKPFYDHVIHTLKITLFATLLYGAINFMFHFSQVSRLVAISYAITSFALLLIVSYGTKIGFRMTCTTEHRLVILPDENDFEQLSELRESVQQIFHPGSTALEIRHIVRPIQQITLVQAL